MSLNHCPTHRSDHAASRQVGFRAAQDAVLEFLNSRATRAFFAKNGEQAEALRGAAADLPAAIKGAYDRQGEQ